MKSDTQSSIDRSVCVCAGVCLYGCKVMFNVCNVCKWVINWWNNCMFYICTMYCIDILFVLWTFLCVICNCLYLYFQGVYPLSQSNKRTLLLNSNLRVVLVFEYYNERRHITDLHFKGIMCGKFHLDSSPPPCSLKMLRIWVYKKIRHKGTIIVTCPC